MKGATSAHPTSEFSQTRCTHGKQNRAICHGRKPLPPVLMLVFHSSLNKFSLDPVARQRCRVFLCSREQISFPGLGRNAAAPRGPSIRTYPQGVWGVVFRDPNRPLNRPAQKNMRGESQFPPTMHLFKTNIRSEGFF